MTVESNIVTAQMSIDNARGEQAATGQYLDPMKWTGLNGYRRVCGFLSQKIQHRLRELNFNKPKQNTMEFVEVFYRQAKLLLPTDTFLQIKLEAEKIIQNAIS